ETSIPLETRRLIDQLHDTSDWVVTADRNACIEYFDSPNIAPAVYDKFVIDAVPERGDLNALKLVTSTSNIEEVRNLLDAALGEMGLSSSERNCRFLLQHLKALSGRLAIRLADGDSRVGELIALALVQAHCSEAAPDAVEWLNISDGFFVPVDEIIT